jgi:hypothetical protein
MGKYPVIAVSFKDVQGSSFDVAMKKLCDTIEKEVSKREFLLDGSFDLNDRRVIRQLQNLVPIEVSLYNSLQLLMLLLHKHYGKKVIVLIDEYDVALDYAFQNNYYDEMVSVLRSLFSVTLKDNKDLEYVFITGCLRISKESIFTGVNNFSTFPLSKPVFSSYFGFTKEEVAQFLNDFQLADKSDTVREWYNGYDFGGTQIYNPWDVLSYAFDQTHSEDATLKPESYWMNVSSNDIIIRFSEMADPGTREEIGSLFEGKPVYKKIKEALTYREIDDSIDHLWSILFTTGYLQ